LTGGNSSHFLLPPPSSPTPFTFSISISISLYSVLSPSPRLTTFLTSSGQIFTLIRPNSFQEPRTFGRMRLKRTQRKVVSRQQLCRSGSGRGSGSGSRSGS